MADRASTEALLETRARQQAAVAELGRRALGGGDLPGLMDEAVALLARTLDVPYAKILELAPDRQSLLLRAGVGWQEGLVGQATVGTGTDSQAGFTLQCDAPVIVEDLGRETRFSGPPLLVNHGVVSGMSVVIPGRHRPFGVLGAHTTERRSFSRDDIHFLEAVANVLGAAIDRKRAEDAAGALIEVGREMAATLDPAQVAERIIASVLRLFGGPRALLYRLDPASEHLVCVAAAGKGDSARWIGRGLPRHMGAVGRAVVEGRPVWYPDVLSAPDVVLPDWAADWYREEGYPSAAAVPLVASGSILGALALADRPGRVFTPPEIDLLSAFASQAAVALANARLFAETARRQREAEELARLGRTLTESLDLEEVGRRIVQSVLPLFGVQSAGLRLLHPDGSQVMLARAAAGSHSDPGDVTPPGTGISGLVVARGGPYRTPNVLGDPRVALGETIRARVEASGLSAFLAVPLRVKGAIIGTLSIADRGGREFSDQEVALLQTIADEAALALDSARLFVGEQRARAEAEASSQRFSDLVQGLDAIVWEAEPGMSRTLFVSQRVEAVLGYPVGAWLADPGFWADHLHPDDRAAAVEQARSAAAEGRDYASEYRFLAADGRVLWLRDRVRLLRGEGGRPRRLFGVTVDVTERKALEEQLRQSQKMEAVGKLAGGVAHDFNNLLTIIRGRSELLLATLGPGDRARRDVELIERTAERAAALTRQLLAFSRKQVLQPRVLDLSAVVAGMEGMLRRLIGEDIELVTRLAPGLGRVRADPGQIEQAIVNLAVNGRDAMPRGGQLVLQTAGLELDATDARRHPGAKPGRHVILTVTDTGSGMDAQTRERIFEPFFTTKGPGKGTGLGLATVYGTVHQSGGCIWVDSEPGRGSTFTICLPRVEAAPEAGAEGPAPASPGGGETILVVEDQEDLRELVCEVLRGRGYTVLEAAAPEAALAIGQRHEEPIHLLLTDVVMPRLSGRQVAERLAPVRPAMKVLYMSGYTDDAAVRHGVLESATAFLPKPFTPEGLARKVREVLDR